jgi:acetolactate synthase-1/2/3 large subunit
MKLSDYIAVFLARHTEHIFVGNGGCVIHILDSIENTLGLKNIPCENEQGAAIAAEAYSRVAGKLGVALATSGPGMINLMQGIACAYFDSIPTLYISGAPPTHHLKGDQKARQIGFQEMDVVGIVTPITKYAVLLKDPKRVRYELEKLVYMATEGRPGPVLLDLPDDLQRADINPEELESFIPENPVLVDETEEKIDEMLNLIKKANRAVIVVGGGVKIGRVEEEVNKFIQKSGIPFLTTWSTIDMFLDDDINLIGNFGISANRAGNFAVQNSDLIICFGSRLGLSLGRRD